MYKASRHWHKYIFAVRSTQTAVIYLSITSRCDTRTAEKRHRPSVRNTFISVLLLTTCFNFCLKKSYKANQKCAQRNIHKIQLIQGYFSIQMTYKLFTVQSTSRHRLLTPCGKVEIYQTFGRTTTNTLKTEGENSTEMLINLYQITRSDVPEDSQVHDAVC
jgi:hypothetical protein